MSEKEGTRPDVSDDDDPARSLKHKMDAILDSALDALDEDEDEDDDENENDVVTKNDTEMMEFTPIPEERAQQDQNRQAEESQIQAKEKKQEGKKKREASEAVASARSQQEQDELDRQHMMEDLGELNELMKTLMQEGEGGEVTGEAEAVMSSFMMELQSQLVSELQRQKPDAAAADTTPGEKSVSSKPTAKRVNPTSSRDYPEKKKGDEEKNGGPKAGTKDEVDRTVSKLLEDMASSNTSPTDSASSTGNVDGNDAYDEQEAARILEEMMKEMGGGDLNADDVIDGMMGQLLSKELMYEPMKQVTQRFPLWLKEKEGSLSKDEYKRRCDQYECFRRLIGIYETEPDNTDALMMLMQEVQEYGQPPPEIVKDIAPGLELDEHGVPKMDAAGMPDDCIIQ